MIFLPKFVGIDPDTNATGIAICEFTPTGGLRSIELMVARALGDKARDRAVSMTAALSDCFADGHFFERAAVECQSIRPSDRRPNDIMALQLVAGMAAQVASRYFRDSLLLPLPAEWRGTIPKEVVQRRILETARLTLTSSVFADIIPSQRTHAIDALGLALWAAGKFGVNPPKFKFQDAREDSTV